MLEQIPQIEIPKWLANLTSSSMQNSTFPLRELLEDSLYYPCSGLCDGRPIEHLGGNIVSFLYVDNGHSEEDFMIKLRTTGFLGYHVLETRKVTKKDLTPNGWQSRLPTLEDDENPSLNDEVRPFFIWTVLERMCNYPENHGPVRFSFLYLCSDAVATFHALYLTNEIAPKAVAIIRPGWSWTDLKARNRIFAKSVLDSNPGGCPEYLLSDSEIPCWPEYTENLCTLEETGLTCFRNSYC